jgi:hypothetical protein
MFPEIFIKAKWMQINRVDDNEVHCLSWEQLFVGRSICKELDEFSFAFTVKWTGLNIRPVETKLNFITKVCCTLYYEI